MDPLGQYDSPYTYAGNNPISMIDPTGMWAGSITKTVIDPTGNIIYHDDSDDKNIYLSPDGKKGEDGNTEGLEVVGEEKPGGNYRKGGYIRNRYYDWDHDVYDSRLAYLYSNAGIEQNNIIYDIVEVVFTGGGLILIRKGGQWLVKKLTKEAIEEIAELTAKSVDDKLARYILNKSHAIGKDKAKWFEQALGFTTENASDLAKQIRFNPQKATKIGANQFGTKYNQIIRITGANGRKIDVTFGWIKNNDDVVRLVTAVPAKK